MGWSFRSKFDSEWSSNPIALHFQYLLLLTVLAVPSRRRHRSQEWYSLPR